MKKLGIILILGPLLLTSCSHITQKKVEVNYKAHTEAVQELLAKTAKLDKFQMKGVSFSQN